MSNFTNIEKQILNRIQKDWHLSENPFMDIAGELKIKEHDLIQNIQKLKNDKIIRDISAIFNTNRLGYKSSLIAFAVNNDIIEKAASTITAHPGVSHNYQRNHKYNIWFTLAVDRDSSLEKEAENLAQESNAGDFLILRNEKLLKIGLMLDIGENEDESDAEMKLKQQTNFNEDIRVKDLSNDEKKAIFLLQMDIPIDHRPFIKLIENYNIDLDEKELLRIAENLKKDGIMRRFSAIIKHNKAGYKANAMTAWKTASEKNNAIINTFSREPNISHLYMRTVYPGRWEYPLFAMIHAKTEEELTNIIKSLEKRSGIKDYLVLNSIKEFKKQRVKYFTEEFQ